MAGWKFGASRNSPPMVGMKNMMALKMARNTTTPIRSLTV
mgnify:CR=1 FL=1